MWFLAKISLHRPTCKTTFARLTQSQAILQSFCIFIIFRKMRDTTFFSYSFIQNYRFLYHGDQKISWWIICRWRAVSFEIHPCSSGKKFYCIWRSIGIQYVQIEPGTLTSEMVPFGSKSVTLSMKLDLLTSTCKSTQVKIYTGLIASTDLCPPGVFTFFGNACAGRIRKQFHC